MTAVCRGLMAVSHRSIWWPISTATLGTYHILRDLRHVLQILPSSISSIVHISSFTIYCSLHHILYNLEKSVKICLSFVSQSIYGMSNKYKRSMCIRVEGELSGNKTARFNIIHFKHSSHERFRHLTSSMNQTSYPL